MRVNIAGLSRQCVVLYIKILWVVDLSKYNAFVIKTTDDPSHWERSLAYFNISNGIRRHMTLRKMDRTGLDNFYEVQTQAML